MHLFPNVANLPLRPPAMLAKQAATIDVLSAGRSSWASAPERSPTESPGWAAHAAAPGRHAARSGRPSTSSAQAGPANPTATRAPTTKYRAPGRVPRPAHDIGLWLGVVGPRAIQLVGAKADGWSVSAPYVPPDRLPELNQIITSAARDAGRDPAAITRLYNVMGLITPQDRDAFNGPVERWAETLTTLHTESQMNAFVFWPTGDRERQSRLFAEQVVPLHASHCLRRRLHGVSRRRRRRPAPR